MTDTQGSRQQTFKCPVCNHLFGKLELILFKGVNCPECGRCSIQEIIAHHSSEPASKYETD